MSCSTLELTHDANVFGIGSHTAKIGSFPILHLDPVGAQLFIEVAVSSLVKTEIGRCWSATNVMSNDAGNVAKETTVDA